MRSGEFGEEEASAASKCTYHSEGVLGMTDQFATRRGGAGACGGKLRDEDGAVGQKHYPMRSASWSGRPWRGRPPAASASCSRNT